MATHLPDQSLAQLDFTLDFQKVGTETKSSYDFFMVPMIPECWKEMGSNEEVDYVYTIKLANRLSTVSKNNTKHPLTENCRF